MINPFRVQSAAFSVEGLSLCQLLIKVADTSVLVGVVDLGNSQCTALEYHTFDPATSTDGLIVRLNNIWSRHAFLQAAFWNEIVLIRDHSHFAFVPQHYYEESKAWSYLSLNAGTNPADFQVFGHQVDRLQTVGVFAIEKVLTQWLVDNYPGKKLTYSHQTLALLDSIDKMDAKTITPSTLYVSLSNKSVTVVALEKSNVLKYLNRFTIKKTEEVLYYLMLTIQELDLEQAKTKVCAWGDFEPHELDFVRPYVQQLLVGKRPNHVSFTHEFDEVPEQIGFELFANF